MPSSILWDIQSCLEHQGQTQHVLNQSNHPSWNQGFRFNHPIVWAHTSVAGSLLPGGSTKNFHVGWPSELVLELHLCREEMLGRDVCVTKLQNTSFWCLGSSFTCGTPTTTQCPPVPSWLSLGLPPPLYPHGLEWDGSSMWVWRQPYWKNLLWNRETPSPQYPT